MDTFNKLITIEAASKLIASGRSLVLAASEDVLQQLPAGNWIGGTIPYFMDVNGGCLDNHQIFVTDFTDIAEAYTIKQYSSANLKSIMSDRFDNGYSIILIPGFSNILSAYAVEAYSFYDLYDIPLSGWVTGIDLADIGKKTPKVFNGLSLNSDSESCVVLHVKLPAGTLARLEILNLFTQGKGDVITFDKGGFECTQCKVNGKQVNLAEYLTSNNIDTKLPLVADYSGAMINISFQNVDTAAGKVVLYAPVRENVEYHIASPVGNYVTEFNKIIPADTDSIAFSCNCILNYLYSELEGKKTGKLKGPFTFGEIAYVLVNQTLVYLSIE